jgi:hypothetical protein
MFSVKYVPQNMATYFLKLPMKSREFPWIDPTIDGFSIFIATPALFLAMAADYRKRINILALSACVAVQALYLSYFSTGNEQFGARYPIDYLPFVTLLAADGSKRLPSKCLLLATIAGVLVELWGIVYWRY